ncbi:MAG: hypothetical protein OEY34_09980, partial [Cyclobacteriaceae bacterium]|nr:hypothetical protein [Cyclobacteriaceae bacterium]
MKNITKKVILTITFILPATVFIFLKFFGTNRFDVPIFYEKSVDTSFTDCPEAKLPYYLAPPENSNQSLYSGSISILTFNFRNDENHAKELQRICERYDSNEHVKILTLTDDDFKGCSENIVLSQEEFNSYLNCKLYTTEKNLAIVIDGISRIRGYYNLQDRKETDRLFTEISILEKNK